MKIQIKKEVKSKIAMAAAVIVTLAAGLLLFYRHWEFEMPGYPNVDEQLSLDCIYALMNQHLYAGDIYVLDFFRYPHLTFYYAVLGIRILGRLFAEADTAVLARYVICGTAVLSNVFLYFSLKIMTGSRRFAYIGMTLAVFSLYGFSYLFYTGPDTMMYAVANVILFLGCLIYEEKDEERAVYLWYPLMAVCIGLAMAAKYHGILFGIFWLALHIKKKYWKSHRNNFLFFINCIVLALVFCLCNYSLFFHFKTFVWDNLYNFSHYAWGHPGIEHNLPLLGYMEAFGLTSYGAVGGILLILGIASFVRRREFAKLAVFLLMPFVILFVLSRYSIVLGRNLSLVMPFAFFFITYGVMEGEQFIKKCSLKGNKAKWFSAKKVVAVAVLALVLANMAAAVNSYRYELTYDKAGLFIKEQIPAGAVVYCTDFFPQIDEESYQVIRIGEDISKLPDRLDSGEYYIDVQYATGYFGQKKDYLLFQGGDMYPDKKAAYEDKLGNYTLMQSYRGISYGKEWKYRVGYLDRFRYGVGDYYIGPTIQVYH